MTPALRPNRSGLQPEIYRAIKVVITPSNIHPMKPKKDDGHEPAETHSPVACALLYHPNLPFRQELKIEYSPDAPLMNQFIIM